MAGLDFSVELAAVDDWLLLLELLGLNKRLTEDLSELLVDWCRWVWRVSVVVLLTGVAIETALFFELSRAVACFFIDEDEESPGIFNPCS